MWSSSAAMPRLTPVCPPINHQRPHTHPPSRRWHALDAFIIVTSAALELALHGVAQEVASLLILFR